tara:strand:- start:1040 stop:1294 length:255 start_codon:yes stop_codon:yes gene_type:complete
MQVAETAATPAEVASLSRTRWAIDAVVAEAVLDAEASRTLVASDDVVDTPTTIDAVNLTRTDAAAVVVVITIVPAPSVTKPSSP